MRRKTEAKRREILEGAARVFEQRGYQGTTLNDIAREVGCSKVTIYNYFDSREDLLKAILVEGARHAMEYLSAQLTGEGPIAARLKSFARTYLMLVMNDYSIAMLRLMTAESDNYALVESFGQGGANDIWPIVEGALEREAISRDDEAPDAALLSARLRALLHGGLHYQRLIGAIEVPDADAIQKEADGAVDVILAFLPGGFAR